MIGDKTGDVPKISEFIAAASSARWQAGSNMSIEAITASTGSFKETAVSHLPPASIVIGNGPYAKKGFLGIDRIACPGTARETVAMPPATNVEPLPRRDMIGNVYRPENRQAP